MLPFLLPRRGKGLKLNAPQPQIAQAEHLPLPPSGEGEPMCFSPQKYYRRVAARGDYFRTKAKVESTGATRRGCSLVAREGGAAQWKHHPSSPVGRRGAGGDEGCQHTCQNKSLP